MALGRNLRIFKFLLLSIQCPAVAGRSKSGINFSGNRNFRMRMSRRGWCRSILCWIVAGCRKSETNHHGISTRTMAFVLVKLYRLYTVQDRLWTRKLRTAWPPFWSQPAFCRVLWNVLWNYVRHYPCLWLSNRLNEIINISRPFFFFENGETTGSNIKFIISNCLLTVESRLLLQIRAVPRLHQ